MLLGALFYDLIYLMAFKFPGTAVTIRFMDEVETEDNQYDVYDIGFQYEDGGIDSVAFGGSFHSLKRGIEAVNRAGFERREKEADNSSD